MGGYHWGYHRPVDSGSSQNSFGVRKKQMSVSHRVDPERPDLSGWHQRSAEHSDRQDHTFNANDLGTTEAIQAGMTLLLV